MKHFIQSFVFAAKGIRQAISGQRNMKIHVAVAMAVAAAGIYYDIPTTEWCLVLLAIGLVITAELMNTSIESIVDLLEPRHHPMAGKVKDIAAGAVLVAALTAVGIGSLVFIKYLTA